MDFQQHGYRASTYERTWQNIVALWDTWTTTYCTLKSVKLKLITSPAVWHQSTMQIVKLLVLICILVWWVLCELFNSLPHHIVIIYLTSQVIVEKWNLRVTILFIYFALGCKSSHIFYVTIFLNVMLLYQCFIIYFFPHAAKPRARASPPSGGPLLFDDTSFWAPTYEQPELL